jgi:ubiquitin-conjugating enzyme E2 Z
VGPPDTPYSNGYFMFKFKFPVDYPHRPPDVKYLTNDGYTRFHPNYYKDGNVCLSLLNTWRGEQWTSCGTIKNILLVLCSLLTDKPLINEPGISENHKDNIPYNRIIEYKTLDVAINNVVNKDLLPPEFEVFYDAIVETFLKNYDTIYKKYIDLEYKFDDCILTTSCYSLKVRCKYSKAIEILRNTYNKLKKNTEKTKN